MNMNGDIQTVIKLIDIFAFCLTFS